MVTTTLGFYLGFPSDRVESLWQAYLRKKMHLCQLCVCVCVLRVLETIQQESVDRVTLNLQNGINSAYHGTVTSSNN